MTGSARTSVLVLGLAGAAGWMSGLVLLPLAAWIALEAALLGIDRVARLRPAARG
jgi:hypothetical protein